MGVVFEVDFQETIKNDTLCFVWPIVLQFLGELVPICGSVWNKEPHGDSSEEQILSLLVN